VTIAELVKGMLDAGANPEAVAIAIRAIEEEREEREQRRKRASRTKGRPEIVAQRA
jgi:hypothetical protein